MWEEYNILYFFYKNIDSHLNGLSDIIYFKIVVVVRIIVRSLVDPPPLHLPYDSTPYPIRSKG